MPIDVSWYNKDKKILLWTIGESWTLDEYYEAFDRTKTMLEMVEQPAYAIVDATGLVYRPRAGLMRHFLKVLKDVELEMLVYVRRKDSPPIVQKLLNLLVRSRAIQVKKMKFALNMEDALNFIRLNQT